MASNDRRVDAYIAKAAGFARPILTRIREQVHAACPEIEETIKWGMPHFTYKDRNLCYMAAFKQHCGFGFWRSGAVIGKDVNRDGAGNFGRLTSVEDLPPEKTLAAYVKKAAALSDAGVKRLPRPRAVKQPLVIPPYFRAALKDHPKAGAAFEAFSYSHKKEYLEWVTGAKKQETRQLRLEQALGMMASGKSRNWKYE